MPQAADRIAPSSLFADSARQGEGARASAEADADRPRPDAAGGRSIPGTASGREVVSHSLADSGPGARSSMNTRSPKTAASRGNA